MKRLGLVGVGAWGRRYIDTIRQRTDCTVAAFARASTAGGDVLPGAVACESWPSLVERAARGELDGVIAATTPENQLEIAAACISAGVPLLVEKPLGLSQAAAESVRSHFERSEQKPPVIVDYVHLWAPAFLELKRRIASREVVRITAEGFNWGPLRSWSSLYDYGPHDVSMCLDVLGRDASFGLRGAERVGTATSGFELFDARVEIAGALVHLRVGNGGTAKARRFTVTASGDRELVYDDAKPHPGKLLDGGAPVPIDEGKPLDAVLTGFLATIAQWKAGRLSAREAGASIALSVRVNAILDAVASSLGPPDVSGSDAPSNTR